MGSRRSSVACYTLLARVCAEFVLQELLFDAREVVLCFSSSGRWVEHTDTASRILLPPSGASAHTANGSGWTFTSLLNKYLCLNFRITLKNAFLVTRWIQNLLTLNAFIYFLFLVKFYITLHKCKLSKKTFFVFKKDFDVYKNSLRN